MEFLQVPYGQSVYHMGRGELGLAQRLDEDLLRLSRQRNDSAGLVLGHLSSGRDLMLVGRFASSQSHLENGIALYDPIFHRSLGQQAGSGDPASTYKRTQRLFCSVSAIRTRHWHRAAQRSLRLGGWLIRRL
ncbi:MAG TPA: hypothetical protein VHT28_09480 [Silvibacterium sp.]|nr:hypothetical protein [Silvibacterium sp.]